MDLMPSGADDTEVTNRWTEIGLPWEYGRLAKHEIQPYRILRMRADSGFDWPRPSVPRSARLRSGGFGD